MTRYHLREAFERLLRDVRFAARSLRRSPGYATAAILTLALGIGANTAIFSVLDAVVLQPLAFHQADRLVDVALYNRSLKYATDVSYPDFLDWQRSARSLEQLAAYEPLGFDLTGAGAPQHLQGYQVSANFFETLGVRLAAGRSFAPEEDRAGSAPVAIISHRLWQERFHGSPGAVGQLLTLNGAGYRIVGILPSAFRFEAQPAEIFTALGSSEPLFRQDRTVHDLLCVGRLAHDETLERARAEMNTLQEHIDQLNLATERGQGVAIVRLKDFLFGDIGSIVALLLGAVALVLLIACANVANLLLARSAARAREFAVRRALGAGRLRIVAQLLTECLLVSLAGGALGTALATWGLRPMLALLPGSLPVAVTPGVNTSVLCFALAISIAVGLLFGLAPSLAQSGADLQSGLKEAGRGVTGGHGRAQRVLAIAQIALALVLLSGAGLLLRTIRNLWAVNPGFDAQHVLTFQAGLSPVVTRHAETTRAAYRQLTQRLREMRGVEAADITALVPLSSGDNSGPFWLGAQPPPQSMAEIPRALYYPTGPDYPRVMHIPLLRGRYLSESDTVHSGLVVLIDNLLARTYFPDGDALGRTLTIPHWGADRNVQATIVGVLGHVEQYGIDGSGGEKPQIYFSLYQLPDGALPVFRDGITFAVRTRLEPVQAMPAIERAVHEASGGEPVYRVRSMRDLVSGSMARQRFPMVLLMTFAGLALLLATIGVYALLSYSVARRVPEIGLRMALGASQGSVLKMLLGEGLRLACIGVAAGALAAAILTRVLRSFFHLLYGVSADDPATFALVSLCLVAAALVACYLPARRAARIDPVTALRQE